MIAPPTLPKFRQQLILAVLMVCSLLIWLDNTVLSTALETLADPVRGLGANPGELQWATGSYTLTFATLMFTAGALGDRFGHRTVFSNGLAIFAGSSLWAAYATDAGQLIAARAAMGVGSALITPAMLAILMWTFTGPARAAAIGIFSTSAGVGMAAGPVLAGFLLDHFWWGSVFLINVPVATSLPVWFCLPFSYSSNCVSRCLVLTRDCSPNAHSVAAIWRSDCCSSPLPPSPSITRSTCKARWGFRR
nr:MFS transporter [Kibdelosporangium philippinense]